MVDLPDAAAEGLLKDFLAEATAALNAIEAEKDRLRQDLSQEDLQKRLRELVHTAKGASGVLSLPRLEAVAAATAAVLDALHEEHLAPTPGIVMLVLGSLDRMRDLLEGVAAQGCEPEGDDSLLLGALEAIPGTMRFLLAEDTEDIDDSAAETSDLILGLVEEEEDEPEFAQDIEKELLPVAGGAFLLFRQGHVLRALDLAHVVWLDLLEQAPQRNADGELEVRVQGTDIALAGYDEVHERNPQGPWPFVVVETGGKWVGVFVDEIRQVVDDPDALRKEAGQADGPEGLRIRVAMPDEFV